MKFNAKKQITNVEEEASKALTVAGIETFSNEEVHYVGERASSNGNLLSVFQKSSNGGYILVLLSQVAKYVFEKSNLPFIELKDGNAKFKGKFKLSSSKRGITMSPIS
jgi:hypothetical protein